MRRGRFGWFLLAVWGAWLFALQGWLAAQPGVGAWTPDLGICLLLALEPRLTRARLVPAVVVVSCCRIAFTADPPLAIVVGYVLLFVLARQLRRVIEIDQPLPRLLLAAFGAACLGAYWSLARTLGAQEGVLVPPALEPPSPAGIAATALAALLLAPFLVRLPGLSLIARRRGGLD